MAGRSVALAQEWLSAEPAGSEKVFQALCRLFGEARPQIFALFDQRRQGDDSDPTVTATSFLDRPVLGRLGKTGALPLMPLAWRAIGDGEFDVALISSHSLGASFARRACRSLVYCHTPPRYLWMPEVDPRAGGRHIDLARSVLRRVDARAATRPTRYLANSTEVQRRIEACYGRPSQIVHPPIDVAFFRPAHPSLDRSRVGLLSAGRFVAYKRHDLAISLADRVGIPLTLAGDGPDLGRLRALAAAVDAPVQIVVNPSDRALRALYQRAEALVMGGYEDFGMVPVEAMACGTPVIAFGRGGALDYIDDRTGVLAEEQTSEAFADAYGQLRGRRLDSGIVRSAAEAFGYQRFYREVVANLEELLR